MPLLPSLARLPKLCSALRSPKAVLSFPPHPAHPAPPPTSPPSSPPPFQPQVATLVHVKLHPPGPKSGQKLKDQPAEVEPGPRGKKFPRERLVVVGAVQAGVGLRPRGFHFPAMMPLLLRPAPSPVRQSCQQCRRNIIAISAQVNLQIPKASIFGLRRIGFQGKGRCDRQHILSLKSVLCIRSQAYNKVIFLYFYVLKERQANVSHDD